MKIRIDEIDDKRYTHRLVFLDLPRLMLARGLGVIHARQTRSPDKHTALKAVHSSGQAPKFPRRCRALPEASSGHRNAEP